MSVLGSSSVLPFWGFKDAFTHSDLAIVLGCLRQRSGTGKTLREVSQTKSKYLQIRRV